MRRLLAALALCAGLFALPHAVRADVPTPLVPPTALSALNAAATVPQLQGQSSFGVSVTVSSFSGALVAECTTNGQFDLTQTWTAVNVLTRGGSVLSTITGATDGVATCPSGQQFRVRVSAFTSGSASVTIYGTAAASGLTTATQGTSPWVVSCTASNCTVVPQMPYTYTASQAPTANSFLGAGGYDGTHFQPFYADSNGIQKHYIVGSGGSNVVSVDPSGNLHAGIWNGSNQAAVDANGVLSSKVCDSSTSTRCLTVDANGFHTGYLVDSAGVNKAGVNSSHQILTLEGNSASILADVAIFGSGVSAKACSGSGNTVIKNSAGIFYGAVVTTTMATNALSLWDNASTNSGVELYMLSSSQAVGSAVPPVPVAGAAFVNGLTCNLSGTVGAATIFYK